MFAANGKQENDPVLGARAIIQAVEADKPPLHLVIGGDALDQIRRKLADLTQELNIWEYLTRSTKFADA